MDQFEKYARGYVDKLLSSVTDIQTFVANGLSHIKIINKALWYKSRIFVKAILLKIKQEQYKSNFIFLANNKIKFDEQISIEGQVIFYKYLFMQQENHLSLQAAVNKKVSYKPSDLENQIIKSNQFLFRFVKFSYSNFEYKLLSLPDYSILVQCRKNLQFLLAEQKKKDEKQYVDIQLTQLEQMKQFRCKRLSSLFGQNVIEWISYHKPIAFKYHNCIFLIQLQMTYEIIVKRTQIQIIQQNGQAQIIELVKLQKIQFPECKFNEELFLIGDQFIKQKYDSFVKINKKKPVNELILDLFSKDFNRVGSLYQGLTQHQLKNIYSVKRIDNLTVYMISNHCKVGDILMVSRKGLYFHAAVYLGGDMIIHVNVQNKSSTQKKKFEPEGKLFRFDNYESFINYDDSNKIFVFRLFYCPYKKEQIIARSIQLSNLDMTYDLHKENCEHKSFELMTGIKYSTQTGILSFLMKPFIKLSLMS